MKISEILHIAADEYLWDGVDDNSLVPGWGFSCDAVQDVCVKSKFDFKIIKQGLQKMGVDIYSFGEFKEFKPGEERQAARYLWLKWAALMAEEQGV